MKALPHSSPFMLGSEVTVTEQDPASPIFLKRQFSAVSDSKMTMGQALSSRPPTLPASWASQPYPHPQSQPLSTHRLSRRASSFWLPKRTFPNPIRGIFFLRTELRLAGCHWMAGQERLGGVAGPCCMALPRASGALSLRTSSRPAPGHLSVSLPWGLVPTLQLLMASPMYPALHDGVSEQG